MFPDSELYGTTTNNDLLRIILIPGIDSMNYFFYGKKVILAANYLPISIIKVSAHFLTIAELADSDKRNLFSLYEANVLLTWPQVARTMTISLATLRTQK